MNEILKLINDRLHTTHGNFTDKPVSDETLKTILEASVRGANASNRQSYSIVVVRGQERVAKVIGCGFASPIALVYCVDFNRIIDVGEHMGYKSNYDNLLNYMTAHTDAIIAAQTAVIAATSLGLGSLFTNSIHNAMRKNLAELYEQLELPSEHIFPVTAVLLGYEDGEPDHKRGRLSGPGLVHYDTYKRLTVEQKDELVATLNDPANNFGNNGPCATFLEFYYTRWAAPKPAEVTAKMDKMLYDQLNSFIRDR